MTENRHGEVVTFYSYNGGTGRTMAIANVAWILAANGKRVLVADWDLESPGLHRFFNPFMDTDSFLHTGGVIDLIREFEWDTTRRPDPPENSWYEQYASARRYAFGLSWTFPSGGTLDFLSAGRQNNDYAASIQNLDWDAFYEHIGGGQFLDALRADMKRHYDYTLIDSRTGVSDVAEICTIQLPDILVACFTFSEQSINGAAQVARTVRQRYDARNIRILPVPMRVDLAESRKANAGRLVAMQRFAGLPAHFTESERSRYWTGMQIPYQPYYAYEETLAVFGDEPGSSHTLLSAYETLTRYISSGAVTGLPPMDTAFRERVADRFTRRVTVAEEEVALNYADADQVWAEWIEHLLVAAGVRVQDKQNPVRGSRDPPVPSARVLTIISAANIAIEGPMIAREGAAHRTPLAVYLTDVRPLPGFPAETSAFVHDQPAAEAARRILALVGYHGTDVDPGALGAARFPGDDPEVFNVPARNAGFTGRQDDLRQLRTRLRAVGAAVVLPSALPVALHGMAGIGKTQLAVEYAHRFRSAYDVVWWIAADPALFIDASLADLGARLDIPAQPGTAETARAVLGSLGRGDRRWLVIFDNAEDVASVARFLPGGRGHVLITSRDPAWSERAEAIQLDVFDRHDAITHLRRRVPAITVDEANQVAERLGDLPIAIAAAAAWLHETGQAVPDYVRHIERHGPTTAAVEASWDLSLTRLRDQSPAAYRLLQLCAVLAPDISLELIYSDEMAARLTAIDASLAERSVRGRLVQQLNRLALVKLDVERVDNGGPRGAAGASIHVHRLLQHVVRARMSDAELAATRHEMHQILAASRPRGDVDDPYTWRRFRLLWPHLDCCDALSCADEPVRRLLIDRVQYLWLTGGLAEGRELAGRIERAWTDRLADVSESDGQVTLRRQLLHLRYQLAHILRDQAHFAQSRALDEAVLARQRELLGEDHPHTLSTAGGLAADLRALGHYATARRLDEETHAAWSRLFGDDDPRTLAALGNLAVSYRLVGDYHAARRHDQVVCERRRVILGAEHPETLGSAANLGRDLREIGEYQASVDRLTEVLATFNEVLGPQSRGALNVAGNLAVSLRVAGLAEAAAEQVESAYERLNDTYGPASPDTLSCRHSRSTVLLALGETRLAAAELEAVRAAYSESLGATHPHSLVCASNLAAAAYAVGGHAAARGLATSAADALAEVLGADHPHALLARMNLAVSTAGDGDPAAAAELIRDVGARLADALGADHPDSLACRANELLVLREVGEREDTDGAGVLDLLAQRVGAGHPVVAALRDGRRVYRIIDPHPF